MHWIKPLSDITLVDREIVGGKAAHLGAMMRAGFNVPSGFVITTDAFVEHFGAVTDPLVRPTTPRLNSELMAEVVQALVEYLGTEAVFAVRSSATEEDSEFASFAGQHSTYYFVPPAQIDQAILDCWMSLWSQAALAYRRDGWAEIDSGDPIRMAVIVQRMLPATRSGVTFSRDPLSASNEAVTEATWGLGAALVDGRVSPDRARADEDGGVVYHVGSKSHEVRFHDSNHDGSRLQTVSGQRRLERVLSTTEVQHLTDIAQQLETLFEAPQDVEWSYVDDELFVLQSRPITTRVESLSVSEPLVIFKPLAENFTEPLTPLSQDLFASALPKIGHFYRGRFYIELAWIRRLCPFDLTDEELAELALLRTAPEKLPLSWTHALKAGGSLLLGWLADGANWVRAAQIRKDDLPSYERVIERYRRRKKPRLDSAFRRLIWAPHSFYPAYFQMFTLNISSGRYFLFIGALNALVKKFAPDFELHELPNTYHGRADMHSLQMLNALHELQTLLHRDPELKARLLEDEKALPTGHPFTIAYDEFIRLYGHRGPRELDLSAPRWRETPQQLLRLISSADAAPAPDTHGAHLAARDALHERLKPWQRFLVDTLIARITNFIELRENTRHYHTMAFAALREDVLTIEKRLLEESLLLAAGDIFFLKLKEIDELVAGDLSPENAQLAVRQRRRTYQRDSQVAMLETLNLEYTAASAEFEGVCASPGQARGQVRVILSPDQGHLLKQGEILVAPYTDPAWTPLFSRAAGIVVATGSFLSHAGTVARELHVPCIVDLKGCTDRLRDGQWLKMDATRGVIELDDERAA